MILDHLGIGVSHYRWSKACCATALEPLGIRLVKEMSPAMNPVGVRAAGFGRDGNPALSIGSDGRTTPPAHGAFRARSRVEVRAFHTAALAMRATHNGPPGLSLCATLVGHNVEAVFHGKGEE